MQHQQQQKDGDSDHQERHPYIVPSCVCHKDEEASERGSRQLVYSPHKSGIDLTNQLRHAAKITGIYTPEQCILDSTVSHY